MQIRVEGRVWDITLVLSARRQAAGLKEGIIPVGATVTIHGHRNLDPKKYEVKTERLTKSPARRHQSRGRAHR
jgi:hypothetical protein